MAKTANWIQKLKAGDNVLVQAGNQMSDAPEVRMGRVLRVTPTSVTLEHATMKGVTGARFNRETGNQRTSDSYGAGHLIEPTEAAVKEYREAWQRYRMVNELRAVKWKNLPTDKLREVHTLAMQKAAETDAEKFANELAYDDRLRDR